MNKLHGFLILVYLFLCIGLPMLKFSGVISLSWGLVLCPLWIPLLLIYVLILIVFSEMIKNGAR